MRLSKIEELAKGFAELEGDKRASFYFYYGARAVNDRWVLDMDELLISLDRVAYMVDNVKCIALDDLRKVLNSMVDK